LFSCLYYYLVPVIWIVNEWVWFFEWESVVHAWFVGWKEEEELLRLGWVEKWDSKKKQKKKK